MASFILWRLPNRQFGAMVIAKSQYWSPGAQNFKNTPKYPPNRQIDAVETAKSPNWRRGTSQIVKLAILYVAKLNSIA